ncbi:N-acetyltransferase [Sphingomonas sp. DBB INV C78]|uniref:GNAT family N-acetyltransferase n=1 Tax=Sphingomonas sp. DBB INV C78 TaxID=3349434 RepID=UPI0036D3CBA1
MTDAPIAIRFATAADLAALHPVIERAYRGDSARKGWTHEADLLDDQRTDMATLEAILANPETRLLVAERDGAIIGCVQITDKGEGTSYLGLLCVDPDLQAGGLGKLLVAAAEAEARRGFAAERMEMTVIDLRAELIRYYERRGYVVTDEKRPFPVVVEPPLTFAVLVKAL